MRRLYAVERIFCSPLCPQLFNASVREKNRRRGALEGGHIMDASREAASKLADERRFEQDEDQFFASRRITERFDLVFIILGAAVLVACVWGALVGAFA